MKSSPVKSISWFVWITYLIVIGFSLYHHELWGDEIHSWNLAKGSTSFLDLLSNIRYEGHPPLWYMLLWAISKISHDPHAIQLLHFLIAGAVAYVVVFVSPYPLFFRALILFGYYFLFEYATLSRNYALGVLFAFALCWMQNTDFKFKHGVYYLLLFLMSNVHLLACVLAASLHMRYLYFLFSKDKKEAMIHLLIAILVLVPSLYFIFPPSDSQLSLDFWFQKWNIKHVLTFLRGVLYATLPWPVWSEYHFWNSHFVKELQSDFGKAISYSFSLASLYAMAFIVWQNKQSRVVLLCNVLFTFFVSLIFPLTTFRYAGYLFIGFLCASWFGFASHSITKTKRYLMGLLLICQVVSGIWITYKDLQLPFSNSFQVKTLIQKIPSGSNVITDYWCLNNLSTYLDRPFYCLESRKETSYLQWDKTLSAVYVNVPHYTQDMRLFFDQHQTPTVYLFSSHSEEEMHKLDSTLTKSFHVVLIAKTEGAIEKSSDVYLYTIKPIEAP